jgi:tRNA pseudouridine32 synthase/23S rRNA pseudouridine746 synthase
MKCPLPNKKGVSPSYLALPKGEWKTILDFLIERFPHIDATIWEYRLTQRGIFNQAGEPYHATSSYQGGQYLYYYRHLDNEVTVPFKEKILYQDDYLIAVDKPHFLSVVPAGKYLQQTLLVRLKRALQLDTISPMHRIDRETAGVVLFSKQVATRGAYQTMFQRREMNKRYEAIAPTLHLPSDPYTHRSRMVKSTPFFCMQEVEGEANSETKITLIETQGELSRYHLQPVTGKQHQLRVHLAALGDGILNDPFYPEVLPEKAQGDFSNPLQLLAKSIAFTDPMTQQQHYFETQQQLNFPHSSKAK